MDAPAPDRGDAPRAPLASAPPPEVPAEELPAERIEFYIRSAMHQDRTPGTVLAVVHPKRLYKVPRGLFDALREAGWRVEVVETRADRIASVRRICDALRRLAAEAPPLDLLVVSGDGTMDHHVLVAAFQAFHPEAVREVPGEVAVDPPTQEELASIPNHLRAAFLSPLPTGEGIEPTEEVERAFWVLRSRVEGPLRRGRSAAAVLRRARRERTDPLLRLAVLGTFLPHRVRLHPPGFDLAGLADGPGRELYAGLYPHLRSIVFYPAGTASDNAVFAGTPGWGYAQLAPLLVRLRVLDPLRRWLERRTVRRFVRFFTRTGVVVPERVSFFGLDGRWKGISSHAAGGPAAGRFFVADLERKTRGMLGYLARIPRVIVEEGFFGSTAVRVRAVAEDGRVRASTEAHLAEGLYTNRSLIGGVGTVPTTVPTSFAGQSSLVLVPPLFAARLGGRGRDVNARSLITFFEGIAKGVAARALHLVGLGVGTMAGGGKFRALLPHYQIAIKEGERIDIEYRTLDGRPRAVPFQVSGDPFQAHLVSIRAAWAPIPVLGDQRSLLVSTTRAVLAAVRLRGTFDLEGVYIGGVHYFRHRTGERWTEGLAERTGLFPPPRTLPGPLRVAWSGLIRTWVERGAGEFVDTTPRGLPLGRRGRYAHNNDHTAHLVLVREPRGALLVRQVRARNGVVYENRTRYRPVWGAWIIHHSQTIAWREGEPPLLVQEDHYFRNAEEFQREAPAFFPVAGR